MEDPEKEKPDKIMEGLYIGSLEVANNKNMLHEYGISHVLTVAWGIEPLFPKV